MWGLQQVPGQRHGPKGHVCSRSLIACGVSITNRLFWAAYERWLGKLTILPRSNTCMCARCGGGGGWRLCTQTPATPHVIVADSIALPDPSVLLGGMGNAIVAPGSQGSQRGAREQEGAHTISQGRPRRGNSGQQCSPPMPAHRQLRNELRSECGSAGRPVQPLQCVGACAVCAHGKCACVLVQACAPQNVSCAAHCPELELVRL